ncbi:MAG: rhodanese-like domain-containing protein [Acidobacteriia bacterium]|nr:rhodanese-like domain-containing protein [Terriglobia bacterium]
MEHSPAFLALVNDAKSRIKQLTVEQVVEKMKRGDKFIFVDTREDNEWTAGRAQGAIHLGRGVIERDIEKAIPDHQAEIILYCGGGFRSALAADNLRKMGYANAISMDGGIRRWRELKLPEEK